jgi:hypothetical protein
VGVLPAETVARAGAAMSSPDRAIASNPYTCRLVALMVQTLGQQVCRIIVKKSRPTTGNGRPLIVATGCTRRGDQSGSVLFWGW